MILSELPHNVKRTVLLKVGNDGTRQFLAALLTVWHYSVVAEPAPGCLVLAEENQLLPPDLPDVIHLSPSGYRGSNRLPLPLSVTDLWEALETRFHRPPRSHLRMAVQLSATATIRDRQWDVLLRSLSSAGARFRLGRELASGETLELSWTLGGIAFHSQAQVIYSIPSGDNGDGHYDTGVIFTRNAPVFGTQLQQQIILNYLTAVRTRIPGWAFTTGLALLDLPGEVLSALDHPVD